MTRNTKNLLTRGPRISLRAKANDNIISGSRVVDAILPVGRGQRQLILGDRYTGKPSISLPLLISSSVLNSSGSIDGSGTKRLFGPYIGINNNPSKLSKLIYSLLSLSIDWFLLVRAPHSAPSSMLSSMLPWIGITIAERLRDRGSDISIRSDDPSKHAKSYRQIPSSIGKIPPRDAYPADVLNIHPPLSERCGKIRMNYFNAEIDLSFYLSQFTTLVLNSQEHP